MWQKVRQSLTFKLNKTGKWLMKLWVSVGVESIFIPFYCLGHVQFGKGAHRSDNKAGKHKTGSSVDIL